MIVVSYPVGALLLSALHCPPVEGFRPYPSTVIEWLSFPSLVAIERERETVSYQSSDVIRDAHPEGSTSLTAPPVVVATDGKTDNLSSGFVNSDSRHIVSRLERQLSIEFTTVEAVFSTVAYWDGNSLYIFRIWELCDPCNKELVLFHKGVFIFW